jgi:murein L,D-transpeptidase YcbB/YkuD
LISRLALCVALAVLLATGTARSDDAAERLRRRVEEVQAGAEVRIGRDRIASTRVLPSLYERIGFARAWTRRDSLEEILAGVVDAETHGLDPRDYHRPELERLLARGSLDAQEQVDLDLLATDALVRLASDLALGKVDPERIESHWNLARESDDAHSVDAILEAITSPSSLIAAERFAPSHPAYARLRGALIRYRELAARGGFERLSEGPKLELGSEGPRVEALRRRLVAEGDLAREEAEGAIFDARLAAAVRRAQTRYGLEPDAVVGRATLAALNVPAGDRVDQIRVNLERARWVLHAVQGRLVLVDIPGFHLHFFDEGRDWTTRVVVGRPYRRTPVFRATIRTLVLNPTWTVPPTIFAEDMLPAIREDPGYLARRQLRVIDGHGREVDPRGIDWSTVVPETFPYLLRQDPGPQNALGRIKFVFPNPYSVYLHDTPAHELFARAERAASSGCIRVEDPLTLAVGLLVDPQLWSREALEAAIASGITRSVTLREPVPVILMYWTAEVDEDGSVEFRRDLYRRDRDLLRALDADFSFRRRAIAGGGGR